MLKPDSSYSQSHSEHFGHDVVDNLDDGCGHYMEYDTGMIHNDADGGNHDDSDHDHDSLHHGDKGGNDDE
uniref:Uncharacterized protein n=1 Tax=Acrobeloides nanus TaxID=290746 RepID=A0A914C8B3_9BILA